MLRRICILPILTLMTLSAGCVPVELERDKLARVPGNPFTMPPARYADTAKVPLAKNETSLKVDYVANKLLAANKDARLRPSLGTIGAPFEEIFHQGDSGIFITEGLVKRCSDEKQLAALLAFEMAEMVVEREARAPADQRNMKLAPIDVKIGGGQAEASGPARLVELAKFEKEHKAPPFVPLPNPKVLARSYLEKAGYSPDDLDLATPLLQAAQQNYTFERQFDKLPPNRWNP